MQNAIGELLLGGRGFFGGRRGVGALAGNHKVAMRLVAGNMRRKDVKLCRIWHTLIP